MYQLFYYIEHICPLIAALSDCPLPDHNICISRSLCLILKSSRHTIISLTQINVWLVMSKRRQSNPFQCSNNQIEMELVFNLSKWGGELVNGRRSGLCRCLVCDRSLMWTHSEALTSPSVLCLPHQALGWTMPWERCPSMWRFSLTPTPESTRSQWKVKEKIHSFFFILLENLVTLSEIIF